MHGTLQAKHAPVHRMEPAKDKLVEAILFLIAKATEQDYSLTQYDIVKGLFFADKSHLNRYGRPVTFDNYVAMKNGPVPSCAYSILKGEITPQELGMDAFPWDRISNAHQNPKAFLYRNPQRLPSDEVLSESDMEALRNSLAVVMSLTFGQIKKLTHEDPAYRDAWGDGESNNAPMSYGLLFDSPNFDEAEHIQFMSQHR
jgi:hypothetical protein